MSNAVALRHEVRPLGDARAWSGSALSTEARLSAPGVRHVRRRPNDAEEETAWSPRSAEVHPLSIVVRLWVGVVSLFALIVLVGLVTIVLGAWAVGYRPVVVTSGSMAPTVRTGDVVITRPVDVGDELGDQTVIDFDDPATAERRLHRVIEVTDRGYRTKGDANADADVEVVPPDHVHGAGFVLAPFVGYLPLWADEGRWDLLVGSGATVVALVALSRRGWMWKGVDR